MTSNKSQTIQIEDLSTKQLDFFMYQHACQTLKKTGSKQEFTDQYQQGQFHFSQDPALLSDILLSYCINIQNLSGDWLASDVNSSAYGTTPTEAACRLVIKNTYGTSLSI